MRSVAEKVGTPADLLGDFRNAMRRLAASVTLVTAFDSEQKPHGIVVTSMTSLTFEPPTILTCINQSASAWPVLAQADCFGASILHSSQRAAAQPFVDRALHSRRFGDDLWDLQGAAPLLSNAQVTLLCRRGEAMLHGSHHILLGEVVSATIREDIDPLVYLDGRFGSVIV
ncbi:MAG: flavin reductase family protein [Sphingomonadaceae bacterium]|nr:flavin reductase family protein [Sphingomonadaceae bacterium]